MDKNATAALEKDLLAELQGLSTGDGDARGAISSLPGAEAKVTIGPEAEAVEIVARSAPRVSGGCIGGMRRRHRLRDGDPRRGARVRRGHFRILAVGVRAAEEGEREEHEGRGEGESREPHAYEV